MASSRPGVGAMNAWRHEVGVRPAPGEVAGQLADDVAVARGQPQRRVAVQGQAVAASAIGVGGGVRAALAGSCRRSSTSRVSSLASSTLGWSNGSMPRTAPAIAVATSQRNELGAEVDRVGDARSG